MNLDEAVTKVNMPRIAQQLLIDCYSQPHRHYHNLDHLSEMLQYIPDDHPELQIVIDAILFHDFVHSPTPMAPGLNEALSIAEYLSYNAKLIAVNAPFGSNAGESFEYERRVIEAINATSRHTEDQQYLGEVSKLVLDLDLSTFALPPDEYGVWRERIERENIEIWSGLYQAEDIKRGRCIFLKNLLKRRQLYYIKTDWEPQARLNIQHDISQASI